MINWFHLVKGGTLYVFLWKSCGLFSSSITTKGYWYKIQANSEFFFLYFSNDFFYKELEQNSHCLFLSSVFPFTRKISPFPLWFSFVILHHHSAYSHICWKKLHICFIHTLQKSQKSLCKVPIQNSHGAWIVRLWWYQIAT